MQGAGVTQLSYAFNYALINNAVTVQWKGRFSLNAVIFFQ